MIRRYSTILSTVFIVLAQSVLSSDFQIGDAVKQRPNIGFGTIISGKQFYGFCAGGGSGMVAWTGSKYQNVIAGGLWGVDHVNLWKKPSLHSALWIDGAGLKIHNSSSEQKIDLSASIHSMVTWESPWLALGGGISVQFNFYDASYHWAADQKRIGFLLAPGFYGRLGTEKNNLEVGVNSRQHLMPGPLSFHINFSLFGTRIGYMTFYANMDKPRIPDSWGIPSGLFVEIPDFKFSNYYVRPMLGLNISGSPPGVFLNLNIHGE